MMVYPGQLQGPSMWEMSRWARPVQWAVGKVLQKAIARVLEGRAEESQ